MDRRGRASCTSHDLRNHLRIAFFSLILYFTTMHVGCVSRLHDMYRVVWVLLALVFSAQGEIVISEFLADNSSGIKDEDGDRSDWIELYNNGDDAVSLEGWWLTDKASSMTQWRFPAITIQPNRFLLVWASGKNRTRAGYPLHTNFSLSKGGEYLGLYRPHATSGVPLKVDEFAPAFPALPPDVSYGRQIGSETVTYLTQGSPCRYTTLTSAQNNTYYFGTNYAAGHLGHNASGGWNVAPAFRDSSWTWATTGIGYDNNDVYTGFLGVEGVSNCRSVMYTKTASMFMRQPFVIGDVARLESLVLSMKYEDGFIAYVNGTEISRANCTNALAWNTRSDTYVNENIVYTWTDYAVNRAVLVSGTNIVAIQGVNAGSSSSDFLISTKLTGQYKVISTNSGYFAVATPLALNGMAATGTLVSAVSPLDPDIPRPTGTTNSPALRVSVNLVATAKPVASVSLYRCVMWNAEDGPYALTDTGANGDLVAGDSVYSCYMKTSDVEPGQMVRWRFEIRDKAGRLTRYPAYLDPSESACYIGTVAAQTTTQTSQLPVLEWFVKATNGNGPVSNAFRSCCYYLTNFYDNVENTLHGQSSRGFPKHSYNFNFTDDARFQWNVNERRVKGINLLSNYADKTKARNTFGHWLAHLTGAAYHYAFPVRVQLNGSFHGVMDLVENGGDRMLERNGLDPDGALYKIYNTVFTDGAEKKTREDEDNSDLVALYTNLHTSVTLDSRQRYAYDNMDIAATVNYLCTRFLIGDVDHGHKNFFLYRDTNHSQEWAPLIWDVDLSLGHVWNGVDFYYDDHLITNTVFTAGGGSPVYNIILAAPEMRQMYVRRFRTLMDNYLQKPGTVNGLFETKLREIASWVDPDPADPSAWTDGDLDAAKWKFPTNFVARRPREEVERLIVDYIQPRRSFLFYQGPGRVTYNTLPLPDDAQTNVAGMVLFDAIDFFPSNATQAAEYVILRNTTARAVDISGWRLEGTIQHTFKGGTVIPAGAGTAAASYVGLLHVVKNAAAFRQRNTGPKKGERRFIQGDYAGELTARGGSIRLVDDRGTQIAAYTYAGVPTTAQRQVVLTQLQYHPASPSPIEKAAIVGVTADEFEYLELLNIGPASLTLSNAYFSDGIVFTFPACVLTNGQRIIVAKNPQAFAVRYAQTELNVFGPYDGELNNSGEHLALNEASGETLFEFTWSDKWHPASDGEGRAMVVCDPEQQPALNDAESWRVSAAAFGAPGVSVAGELYSSWASRYFSEDEMSTLLISGPEADPDNDGVKNWVEYARGSDPWSAETESAEAHFSLTALEHGHAVEFSFERNSQTLDVDYAVISAVSLTDAVWTPQETAVSNRESLGKRRERVRLRVIPTATESQRFYRLQYKYNE